MGLSITKLTQVYCWVCWKIFLIWMFGIITGRKVDWVMHFLPQTFTVTSEHIRCYFLVLHFLVCCHTTLWNINVTKQANNNKLQGSVATYLRCGGLSVTKLRKVYCWVCQWKFFFKSVNIWQLQARRCLSRALCVPGHHTAERWRKYSLGHALSSHPSWSLDILYRLLPFTAINSILFVHFTCLTVLSYNLFPGRLWSSSWSWTLNFILHTFLHPTREACTIWKEMLCWRAIKSLHESD